MLQFCRATTLYYTMKNMKFTLMMLALIALLTAKKVLLTGNQEGLVAKASFFGTVDSK